MPIENTDLLEIDQREASIRQRIYEESHFWADAPEDPDSLIGTYYLRARTGTLTAAGKLISYHMTTGV